MAVDPKFCILKNSECIPKAGESLKLAGASGAALAQADPAAHPTAWLGVQPGPPAAERGQPCRKALWCCCVFAFGFNHQS